MKIGFLYFFCSSFNSGSSLSHIKSTRILHAFRHIYTHCCTHCYTHFYTHMHASSQFYARIFLFFLFRSKFLASNPVVKQRQRGNSRYVFVMLFSLSVCPMSFRMSHVMSYVMSYDDGMLHEYHAVCLSCMLAVIEAIRYVTAESPIRWPLSFVSLIS